MFFLFMICILSLTNTAFPDAVLMRPLLEQYATDKQALENFYSIPWSNRYFDRMDRFMTEWQHKIQEIPFHHLSQDEKVDYHLIMNELGYQKRLLANKKSLKQESEKVLPFAEKIMALEETRWQVPKIDPEQTASQLTDIFKSIQEIRKKIESAPQNDKMFSSISLEGVTITISPVLANRAAGIGDGLIRAIQYWFSQYNDYHPSFSWWCKTPYEKVEKELKEYTKFLRETVAKQKGNPDDPLIGEPVGEERLYFELAHELIPESPAQLLKTGEKEFSWCLNEMKKAAGEMGFGDDWKAALAKVKTNHVDPGEQDQLVAKMARQAISFIDEHQLVTIPDLCRETWRVEMLSQESQKTLPFAAYSGLNMLVAYSAAGMDDEQKQMAMKGNNSNFIKFVSAHELIPGHHLQGFMAQRNNPYRRNFATPFAVEGWALYWEMLLWDMNYPKTPEERIGSLFWRMARCARIIISLKFHLGQMIPQEMIDFLVNQVGMEKEGATSEVRRYIGEAYSPLYQCAYMIGGLQFRALRKELVDSGKMTEQQFHDAVLEQNTIPVALIRAALTKQKLARDKELVWDFLH